MKNIAIRDSTCIACKFWKSNNFCKKKEIDVQPERAACLDFEKVGALCEYCTYFSTHFFYKKKNEAVAVQLENTGNCFKRRLFVNKKDGCSAHSFKNKDEFKTASYADLRKINGLDDVPARGMQLITEFVLEDLR